jgi:voltage-gated potassium channel Kch
MLQNFFKLNPPFSEFLTPEEFINHFDHSDHLKDILYKPDLLEPKRPQNQFNNYIFENVSFAKTIIKGVNFKRCKFKDCLFIGTKFIDCEFHRCTFDNCNHYKASFENTYINPKTFSNLLRPADHSNIGVYFYQQLLANSTDMGQNEFANIAEYYFKLWQRYQLVYEWKKNEINNKEFISGWFPNFIYYWIAGYGLKSKIFAIWTILMLTGIICLNYNCWNQLSINGKEGIVSNYSWVEAIYFSIITITTVGYGDLTPLSKFGMLMISFEAIFGIIWLSVFASIIIKKVVR